MDHNCIRVWAFHDAPAELRDLCWDNGGDEDWLAVLPPSFDEPPFWLQGGSSFGVCSTDEYRITSIGEVQSLVSVGQQQIWETRGTVKDEGLFGCSVFVGCHA